MKADSGGIVITKNNKEAKNLLNNIVSKVTAQRLSDKRDDLNVENLYALINNTCDLMWSIDRNYQLITANRAFIETVKYMYPASIDADGNLTEDGFSKELIEKYKKYYDRAFSGETFTEIEYTTIHEEHWSEISFNPIHNGVGIIGAACHAHDITNRKKSARRLQYVNRMYAFISEINQAIVRSSDEETVFNEACRIAFEIGKFKAAWIGIFNKEEQTISSIAAYGIGQEDICHFKDYRYEDSGPQHHVLLTRKYFVCNNIHKELGLDQWGLYARDRGYQSLMVLPIKKYGNIIGTFNLYANETDFFNKEEITLLEETANDISFAIDVFEKDRLRTLAENKLKLSELHLKEAQAIAHIGSWELDFKTGVADWSDEALGMYGLTKDENFQTYDTWLSFIHPEDLEYVLKVNSEAAKTFSDVAFFHRIVWRNGEIRSLYSHAKFQFDTEGKPKGLRGVSHDVTEMKETERALKYSEAAQIELMQFNQQLIDASPVAIASYDAVTGQCVSANPVIGKIIGASLEDVLSQNFRHIQSWKKSGMLRDAEATLLTGKTHQNKVHFTTSFGVEIWIEYKFVKFLNRNHPHLLFIFNDITEQKKAEEAFKKSELRYRQIVETANEGIWMIDENSKIVFVNKRVCEIFEYTVEEVIGKEIFRFVDSADRLFAIKVIGNRKKGISESFDFRYTTKSGRNICVNISASPVYDETGIYRGALAMVTDITEKKMLEETLLKQKMAEQNKIAKAVISAQEKERSEIGEELHDNVNQLLAAAKLYLNHSLTQGEEYKPFVIKSVDYLVTAMTELRKLSHALVGVAQDEALGLNISLTELINSITAVKNIAIEFNNNLFVESKSESGVKLVVYRIIQEQLSNILKHAEASRVDIEIKNPENYLIVTISDNGKGFNTSAKKEGIGLKNIKHRASLYNGVVNIVSAIGKGCVMEIVFPDGQ